MKENEGARLSAFHDRLALPPLPPRIHFQRRLLGHTAVAMLPTEFEALSER